MPSQPNTVTDNSQAYVPPKVWKWDHSASSGLNRPIAGATHEKELPVGNHPLQLYSVATANGKKITIMLEELFALGHKGAEYDAWLIRIGEGDQFGSGFVDINPNSKIPALVDRTNPGEEIVLFESGSILLQLSEKFDALIPKDPAARSKVLNWLFWQSGSAPYLGGGGFGHFYHHAAEKQEYPINRFTMETKRQFDVLDRQLAKTKYIAGDEYSIADIALWPWYGDLVLGDLYGDAAEFLDVTSYPNLLRWAEEIAKRPAVKRGYIVNRIWGEKSAQLHERHDATDFESKTADKLKEAIPQ